MSLRYRLPELSRRRAMQLGAAGAGLALSPWASATVSWGATKTLTVRSQADFQILDPGFRLASAEDDIMELVFNKLIRFRTDTTNWETINEIATAMEKIDDLTVKFTIQKGIPWSNGFGEMTSEDVKYSFERIADFGRFTGKAEDAADYVVDWQALKEVEIIDDYTGVIHLKEPFAPLWTSSLPYGSGCIVCKAAVEALPEKKFSTEPPATNGPYRFREWVPKQKLVVEVNPDWPLEKPPFDEIVILPIEDDKAGELAYEAGEVDISYLSMSSLPRLKEKLPENSAVIERQPLAYIWLGVNTQNPGTEDIKVRRAIQMAVNVDEIIEAAFFGVSAPATGIVAPGLIGHREKRLYGYDPEQAKALLGEAGAAGRALTLSCLNDTDFLAAAQVIQANLAAVGLTVTIDPRDSGTFWTLGFKDSPEYDKNQLILNRFTMAPDPSWATEWFTPHQIGIWNWEKFDSAEFGDLHAQGIKEGDAKKRHEIYVRMQDLMEESGGYLFITHGVNSYIHRSNIVPAMRPDGQNLSYRYFAPA